MQQMSIAASLIDFAVNRQKSIVIVENNPDTRSKIASALQEAGFLVYATDSGLDALAHIHQGKMSHLVILDVMLVSMNSLELAKQLKKQKNVVILFISTKCDPEMVAALLERYGEDVLCKPLAIPELVARVQRIALRMPRFPTSRKKATHEHKIGNQTKNCKSI